MINIAKDKTDNLWINDLHFLYRLCYQLLDIYIKTTVKILLNNALFKDHIDFRLLIDHKI